MHQAVLLINQGQGLILCSKTKPNIDATDRNVLQMVL